MGRGEIAIGISRATIENAWTPASTLACAPAPHKFAFNALRALDSHCDRARVLALRISGAAYELAEAPAFLYQVVATFLAFFFERLVRLESNARALHHASRGLAVGIAGASQEGAKS